MSIIQNSTNYNILYISEASNAIPRSLLINKIYHTTLYTTKCWLANYLLVRQIFTHFWDVSFITKNFFILHFSIHTLQPLHAWHSNSTKQCINIYTHFQMTYQLYSYRQMQMLHTSKAYVTQL